MNLYRISVAAWLLIVSVLQLAGFLAPLSSGLSDLRFRLTQRQATGSVVIVEMDEESIRRVGMWPWPRSVYAKAIDQIVALGASDIGIDVDLSSPGSSEGDAALEAALARADGIVSLAAYRDPDGAHRAVAPLERFADKAWIACVDVRPDHDGRVRSYLRSQAIGTAPCITMPMLIAGGAANADQPFEIDYSIDPRTLDRVSLAEVLDGKVEPSRLAGRKVLLGASAIGLRDFFIVPIWGTVPGVVLQGLATETLLQDRALTRAPGWVAIAGLGSIAVVGLIGMRRRRALSHTLLALLALSLAIELTATLLQTQGATILDTAAWHIALATLAGLAVVRALGLGRLLLDLSRAETREVWNLVDRVIAENFTGIVVADGARRIRATSREACELLGLPRGTELTGRTLDNVLPAPLLAAVDTAAAVYRDAGSIPREPIEIDCSGDPTKPRFLEYALTLSIVDRTELALGEVPKIAFCLMFRDVTERKMAREHVERLARYDALTGVPNRNLFFEELDAALRTAESGAVGVAHFDLDGFKAVNDGFGHGVGDDLLKAVALRLANVVGEHRLFARLGGDEFAMILRCRQGQARQELWDLGKGLLAAMETPFVVGPYEIVTSVSIGLAQHDDGNASAGDLMKKADAALYQAKRAGGGGARFYDAELDQRVRERVAMEDELRQALSRRELSVVYQPQIDLLSTRIIGVEALLRWRSPTRGPVSPAEFIPIAEQTGMMTALGEFVLAEACREVAGWPSDIKLSVNVSSVQFERSDLVGIVERTLQDTGLEASRLALEITESLFIQNAETVSAMLARLRRIGVEIALDDFGTGYSSLGYIRRFPIDKIKIDQSFVRGLPLDVESTAIIRAILSMGDSLRLKVVAEGIETKEQAEMLRYAGCREGQGFLFGRPESAAAICDAFFGDLRLVSA